MTDFIEIARLVKEKETKITIARRQIISIKPDSDKTKITLMQLEYGSSMTILCPLPYEQFITQYKILD